MTTPNIKVYRKGLDKHELVEIQIFDLPKTIRKIYGFALDNKQARFFKMLGFKKEAGFKKGQLMEGVYSLFPEINPTNPKKEGK